MMRVAIYARYSNDKQNDKSNEDQIRVCRELAQRNGWIVPDENIFTDSAVSVKDFSFDQRPGCQSLLAGWTRGDFDVILADEFGRFSRHGVEQALILDKLEKNRRVQMVTADGIDTRHGSWQMQIALKSMVAQEDIRKLRHFVGRGMLGQLERGYMIAAPAFGYDIKRVYDERQKRIGTHWVVNEEEARIVRRMYQMREQGSSLHQIAAWLNSEGVHTGRKPRKEKVAYWRPSRVRNLLTNTIYKGVFVWHGSTTHRSRAQKLGASVEPKYYSRPDLRLVSDETWNRCTQKTHSRTGYGGGKHYLSGLLTCGHCSGTLVLSAHRTRQSLYCAACTIKNAVHPDKGRLTSTIRTEGLKLLLKHALALYLSPGFMDAYKASLKTRLTGGQQQAVEECQVQLKQAKAAQERFSRMLKALTADDPVLETRYFEAQREVAEKSDRLRQLEAGHSQAEKRAVQAQLAADPARMLDGLLDSDVPPERLRSILARLFPSILFLGKEGRYTSYFRVQFAPGAVLAMASDTEPVDIAGHVHTLKLKLYYKPDNRPGEGGWTVSLVPDTSGD